MYIRNVAAKSTKIDAINRRMMNEAMVWLPAYPWIQREQTAPIVSRPHCSTTGRSLNAVGCRSTGDLHPTRCTLSRSSAPRPYFPDYSLRCAFSLVTDQSHAFQKMVGARIDGSIPLDAAAERGDVGELEDGDAEGRHQ